MSETIYDEQVAPLLLEAARICHEAGMPMLAQVEYEPGEYGLTADLPSTDKRSLPMDWALVAFRSRGNADTLIMHLMAQARERGHSAATLMELGVPPTPTALPPLQDTGERDVR